MIFDPGLDNPEPLQRICLDFICKNLDSVCSRTSFTVEKEDVESDTGHDDIDMDLNFALDQLHKKLEAKISQNESKIKEKLHFSSGVDDGQLLFHTKLSELGLINDLVLTLFDGQKTCLKKVKIENASKLTVTGLQSLSYHNLTDLEISNLVKATVNDLIQSLNPWTLENLKTLNVSNSTFVDAKKNTIVVALSKLRNLSSLNVSGTEFNRTSLEMIMDDLPMLENLDISNTKVRDISSLLKAKNRLKSLSIAELKLAPCGGSPSEHIEILAQLENLRHLDISDKIDNQNDLFETTIPNAKLRLSDFLEHCNCVKALPKLVSLDISGRELASVDFLLRFLAQHPKLSFLGLMMNDLSAHPVFTNNENLTVTGKANEKQVLEALRRYHYRPKYIEKALYHLFQLTNGYTDPREDFIRNVLRAARQYPSVYNIQMAVTACLYNLCHGDLAVKLHPHILRDVVNTDLDAMETFHQHQQLQKNILLTICCDRIINDVNFDRFRCAKLALKCLGEWQDNSMNKMSVAICSMLAARITTAQTSELGSHIAYMQKLLAIVRTKKQERSIDVTLKYTLSALWNLTDESPMTCQVFLVEGGMDLFIEVLDTFPGDKCIETKVLGLLNNIAEVPHLRSNLLKDQFLANLRSLMYSHEIEVSYFAAGIAAHLSSDETLDWTKGTIDKTEFNNELEEVVMKWKMNVPEMVAYRSFRPFYPLMAENQPMSVQLWAVWALHHVCCNKGDRYCPMLESQGGDEILYKLLKHRLTNIYMKSLIEEIFETLRSNGYRKY